MARPAARSNATERSRRRSSQDTTCSKSGPAAIRVGPQSFDVADGDAVNFRCYGGRIWPIYALSFVVPSLALFLKRE